MPNKGNEITCSKCYSSVGEEGQPLSFLCEEGGERRAAWIRGSGIREMLRVLEQHPSFES